MFAHINYKFASRTTLLLLTIFISQFSFAAKAKEQFSTVNLKLEKNKTVKLSLYSYKNHLEELEIRIEASGMPGIFKGANPIIGYARDLNDNGKIDTWFFTAGEGVKTIELEGSDYLGRDVLVNIFKKEYGASFGLYTKTAILTVFKYLLVSTSQAVQLEEDYFRDWIDLEDADIRFKKLATKVNYEQTQFHYEIQSQGYAALAKRMDEFVKKEYWLLNGLDIGLYASGAVVLKWMGTLTAKIGISIGETTLFKEVQKELYTIFEKHLSYLKNKSEHLMSKIRKTNSAVLNTATAQMIRYNWRNSNALMIKGMRSKNFLVRMSTKTLNGSVKLAQGAFSEWRYIALNASVQVAAETAAHYDEVYDENPLIMAQNVLSNDEIQQNIAFMTSDTILMTAASKNLTTTKSKFAVGGMIALVNSTQMNLLIKGEDNYTRVAVDTGWEAIVGNTQVQLDLIALSYFEELAKKKNNPKLKLIGYAVTLVDMGVGYYAYSKVAQKLDEKDMNLVPIFVEK